MNATIIIFLFLIFLFFIYKSITTSRKIRNAKDFFSFGEKKDPTTLRKSFTATNASFTTSFVTLFLFSAALGPISFATPIGFFVGIIIYSYLILPRQIKILATGKLYPELIGEQTHSQKIRKTVSFFIIANLFIFTFAEIQGLQLFIRELMGEQDFARKIVPPALVILMAWYVARSGYRGIIENDKFQNFAIYVGTVCLFLIILCGESSEKTIAAVFTSETDLSDRESVIYILQSLIGFSFSQLIYYDNWQRLSYYVAGKVDEKTTKDDLKKISDEIAKNYAIGAFYLLVIYTPPILIGLQTSTQTSGAASIKSLAEFFINAWSSTEIFGINFGPALVVGSLLFMLGALISTAEVYIIGIVNSFVKDILQINLDDQSGEEQENILQKSRFSSALFCLLLIPLLMIETNRDTHYSQCE